jgi:hypothetical protein
MIGVNCSLFGGTAEDPPDNVEDNHSQDDKPAAGAAQVGDKAVAEGEKDDSQDEGEG